MSGTVYVLLAEPYSDQESVASLFYSQHLNDKTYDDVEGYVHSLPLPVHFSQQPDQALPYLRSRTTLKEHAIRQRS